MINPDLLWFGLLDSGFFSWFFLKVPSYFAYIYSNLKRTPKMRARKSGKDPPWALNVPFSGYNHLIISHKCHNFQSVNPPFRASHFWVQPVSGASGDGGWEDCELTESGHFVRRCFWVGRGSPMKISQYQAMDFINGWNWEMIPHWLADDPNILWRSPIFEHLPIDIGVTQPGRRCWRSQCLIRYRSLAQGWSVSLQMG